MRFSFWLQMVITVVVGVIALLNASTGGSAGGTISFLIFFAAVAYGFFLIRREFDHIDHSRH
ncbi:MAG: hypothetical protein ACREFZ_06380 [Acetobacteraceae bacterium]